MSSNVLKRQRDINSIDNNSTLNSLINDTNDDSNYEPPTKQIKTNDVTKYLSTNDNYINDLLKQIDELKFRVHYLEEQQKKPIVGEDKGPILTIKYQNENLADKYNKSILSFLNETFKNSDNVVYNIRCHFTLLEVFEEKLNEKVININDKLTLPEKNVDEIIIIDNVHNEPPVDDKSTLSKENDDEIIIIDNVHDEPLVDDKSTLPKENVDKIIIDNVHDEPPVVDKSTLLKENVDEMVIIENDNEPLVDNFICFDTAPNRLNDYTDCRYNVVSNENTSNSKNTSTRDFGCFNCGDNGINKHSLKDCPHPKNWERINTARKKFKDQSLNQRYHVTDNENDSKFALFKPGELSKELRHALGLRSKDIPLHIYKMRLLGYPPGWYAELVKQNDTLSMFTDDQSNNTINNNSAVDSSNFVIKDSMIIEYPGFNVPLHRDVKDEYWKYKVPPIQESQLKHNFLLFLNQYNNSSSEIMIDDTSKNNIIDITNDTTDDDNDERLSVEMEILPNTDESLPLPTDSTDFNSQDGLPSSSNTMNDDNRIDNEIEDSNQESSDDLDNNDNNTSSSTFSNNDMKSASSSQARTPLLTKVSTFKSLPETDNFSKDMGPLIMFENLSDSVGTYNKMRGLLNKVRTSLKNIHPSPS